MTKLQTVLKGLECCTADDERFDLCKSCPYKSEPGQKGNCMQLEKDALEVLKELVKEKEA